MAVEIRKVTDKKDLKRFIQFEFEMYQKNPYWVPPLISDEITTMSSDKNPAFDFCEAVYWMAFRDGKMVGRIAGIINNAYIKKWGNKYARWGWFDAIDDSEVAKALFDTVEKWAREKGLNGIQGPLGFTDIDYEGMLIEGFDELSTMPTNYNYPYYIKLVEENGYVKDVDWNEYEVKVPKTVPEKAEKLSKIVMERRKLHMLNAKNSKELMKYGKQIFHCIDEAYVNLYGVTPLTDRQVDFYIKMYLPNVGPEFVKVVLDENDRVVGVVIAMPSIDRALQKAHGRLFPFGFIHLLTAIMFPKRIDLLLGAILPEYQGKGVDALIMNELTKTAIKKGIISAETNPELELNEKVQGFWHYYEARQHKKRRAYIKKLV